MFLQQGGVDGGENKMPDDGKFMEILIEEWEKTVGDVKEKFGSIASVKEFFSGKKKTQQGEVSHSRITGWNRKTRATRSC